MHTNTRFSDDQIEANASLVATAVLTHPASLIISTEAVAALMVIAERDPPAASPPERRLLRDAVAFLDAAEIAAGRATRP